MNTFTKLVAIAAIAVLATSALAQRGQGGGGGQGGGQGRGGGQRGGMMGGQTSNLQLAARADVRLDLGTTAEQNGKLDTLQGGMRERMQGMFQGGGGGGDREAMMAAFQKMNEETDKEVATILGKEKTARLEEIKIQLAGNRALLLPAVQKLVGLNETQLQKVKDLQAKQGEANAAVMEKMRNGELDREQLTEIRAKNDKVLGDELVKILTPGQAEALKKAAGKPFKADG